MPDFIDRCLIAADAGLRTLSGTARAARPRPAAREGAEDRPLTESERRLAGSLMRVNHVGEVCAQALYQAQALTARSDAQRQQMELAAGEEQDHLAWTEARLRELNDRPSASATAGAWASSSKPSTRSKSIWPGTWTACRPVTLRHERSSRT